MKKILIFLVFFLNILFAGERFIKSFEFVSYEATTDNVILAEAKLTYYEEWGTPILYIEILNNEAAVILSDSIRHQFINIIDKYKEWNLQASRQGVELTKTIDTLQNLYGMFKTYTDETEIARPFYIEVYFASINPNKHLLVLKFSKLQSLLFSHRVYQPRLVFLTYNKATELRNTLTDKALEKFKQQLIKRKQIEEQFK